LSWRSSLSSMWRDHLNAIVLGQLAVQPVAVVGFVADHSRGERVEEEALSEDSFDKLAFVRRSAFDTNGERKTVIIGKSEDFRAFAAGRPDREAPLFCPCEGDINESLF
jgi:hypothetical protein